MRFNPIPRKAATTKHTTMKVEKLIFNYGGLTKTIFYEKFIPTIIEQLEIQMSNR